MKGYSIRTLRGKISFLESEQGYGVITEIFGVLSKDRLLRHRCQPIKLSRESDVLRKGNINKCHLRER